MHHQNKSSDNLFHKDHPRMLLPELGKLLHNVGWLTANGGDISIKQGKSIYMVPAGVPRERIDPQNLFILKEDGTVSISPSSESGLKNSAYASIFMKAFNLTFVNAVLYSQSKNAVLASMIYSGNEFKIKDLDMIKNLWNPAESRFYGPSDEVIIPIIERMELPGKLAAIIKKYPKVPAVIVRKSGILVWGNSWENCKGSAECIDFLMETSVEMEKLGLNEYTHDAAYSVNVSSVNNSVLNSTVNTTAETAEDKEEKKPDAPAKTSTKAVVKKKVSKKNIKTGRVTKGVKKTNNARQQNNKMNGRQMVRPLMGNNMMGNGPPPMMNNGPPRMMNNGPMMGNNGPMNPMNMMGNNMMMGPGGPMMGNNMMGGPMMGPGGPMMGPGGPMIGPGGPMMGPGGPMRNSGRPMRQMNNKRKSGGAGPKNNKKNVKSPGGSKNIKKNVKSPGGSKNTKMNKFTLENI